MSPDLRSAIAAHINTAFELAEERHDITIPDEDKDFLLKVMPMLFETQVNKFVSGAVEHNDSTFLSMSPDDMIREALKESTDLPFYLYGYFRAKATRR